VSTLPTERDLPPAAREAARARVVEAVNRRSPSRRWIPLAAAAGLTAVVAGAAVTVAVTRDGAPQVAEPAPTPSRSATPSTTPSATPSTAPSPRSAFTPIPKRTVATVPTMVADCATSAHNTTRYTFEDNSAAHLKVLFHDQYGYLIEIVTAKIHWTCDISPTGTVLNGSGGSRDSGLGSEPGYVTRPGIAVEVTAYGGDSPTKQSNVFGRAGVQGVQAAGHVRKGVAKVVVSWHGLPPVTAALDGPFFLARATYQGKPGQGPGGVAIAYDAAGHELGRSTTFS
jgi:hypothetical protein